MISFRTNTNFRVVCVAIIDSGLESRLKSIYGHFFFTRAILQARVDLMPRRILFLFAHAKLRPASCPVRCGSARRVNSMLNPEPSISIVPAPMSFKHAHQSEATHLTFVCCSFWVFDGARWRYSLDGTSNIVVIGFTRVALWKTENSSDCNMSK